MGFATIQYEKDTDTGIAVLTLDRPEKLNALSEELQTDIKHALAEAAADEQVRVVILKANGRAFSVGYDLAGGHKRTPAELGDYAQMRTRRWMEAVWWNPKPIIAQVHGYCLAGGGDLAAICDMTIASDDAIFGYPVTRLNPHPPITFWPWVIGFKKTNELILTGKMMGAEEAKAAGLVNTVVPRDQLDGETMRVAKMIALSTDKRWHKQSIRGVWERFLGTGGGMQHIADAWSVDMDKDPIFAEWNRRISEEGLRTAIAWRDQRFAEVDH
jgi:enoyl-CoA hydratase